MKKNGFTLVELLAVITLISVISLIAMPAVQESIYTSKQKAYDTQISNIKKAAKDWSSENLSYLPEEDGDTITITLFSLMSSGYIEDSLVNPKTDKYFDPNTVITITRKNKDYKYDVEVIFSNEKVEVDHDAPILFLNGDYVTYVEINDSEGYKDLGVTSDISNLSYTTNYYKVTNNSESSVTSISINSLAKYRVEYCASNDGKESCISRYVIVRDTIAPVITVPITETISASQVASYNLKSGVSVTDNSGKSITPTVSGKLETAPGKYVITYTATDASGNKKTKKRTIIVGCTCSESNTCTVYNDGQPVYFNVTTGKKCSESEAVSTTGTKSGCMKFYAFSDSNSSCYVNLLLDHNTTPLVAWASTGKTMDEVVTALRNDTSSWVNVEYINETYDKFDYSGYKARLITADEIAKITGANTVLKWDSSKNYAATPTIGSTISYYVLDGQYGTNSNWQSIISKTKGSSKFAWLFENTYNCTSTGCNTNDNDYYPSSSTNKVEGYWTSTIFTSMTGAWQLYGQGVIRYQNITTTTTTGLRPVININKSLLK